MGNFKNCGIHNYIFHLVDCNFIIACFVHFVLGQTNTLLLILHELKNEGTKNFFNLFIPKEFTPKDIKGIF